MKPENIERIARVTHEMNRIYCELIGDDSQLPHNEAPRWQKDSEIDGVVAALAGASPEQLHENWLKLKAAEGWVYGEVKDAEAKTHPCVKPYAELLEEQRMKDHIFADTVIFVADWIRNTDKDEAAV